jgi:dipeptidyl-peptidase-4
LKTRILATYNFVHEVLSMLAEHRTTIKSLVLASDAHRPDSVAVRSTLGPPTQEVVVAEITRSAGEGDGGYARRQRTGVYRSIRMPVFGSFQALRSEAVPEVYLVPPRLRDIVDLLRAQGIAVDSLTGEARLAYQEFSIDSLSTGPLFEGHRTVQVEGLWSSGASDTLIRPGWYLVRTRQALGVLAAYLLEPASEDGMVVWNFLDRELRPHAPYPILRAVAAPGLHAIAVP